MSQLPPFWDTTISKASKAGRHSGLLLVESWTPGDLLTVPRAQVPTATSDCGQLKICHAATSRSCRLLNADHAGRLTAGMSLGWFVPNNLRRRAWALPCLLLHVAGQ